MGEPLTQPVIRSRREWGAQPPKRPLLELPTEDLAGIVLHWFGSPNSPANQDAAVTMLQAVQRTHLNHPTEDYSDIAYNHAVDKWGRIWELRGFGFMAGANGAVPARPNHTHAAVVYMAGEGDRPSVLTKEGRTALADLFGEYERRGCGRDHRPHGFFTGSECPGPLLRAWLAADGPNVDRSDAEANAARRAVLRAWLLARVDAGWTWERIKKTANWREFLRRGGT